MGSRAPERFGGRLTRADYGPRPGSLRRMHLHIQAQERHAARTRLRIVRVPHKHVPRRLSAGRDLVIPQNGNNSA